MVMPDTEIKLIINKDIMNEEKYSCLKCLIVLLGLFLLVIAINAAAAGILLVLYNALAVSFGWITLKFWQIFVICIVIYIISRFMK
jgi:Ni/Fe-hydrogenase subunit HybB-like protein